MQLRRPASPGFTMIDMIMVTLVLGLVAMVAAPSISAMATHARINSAATELVCAVDTAISLAATHGRPFGVYLSCDRNIFEVYDDRYRLETSMHLDASPPVHRKGRIINAVSGSTYTVDLDERPYSGVEIQSPKGATSILLYPDGHASMLDLCIDLTYRDQIRQIMIDGLAGRVSVGD